jgi:predicted MFS family arabinose efflux permease
MHQPRISRAWLALLVVALVLFVGGGARFLIGLSLKPIDAELAGGRSLVGLAVLAFQIVSAVAMLAAGRLADRCDIRLVLSAGLLLAATGLGLTAWVATGTGLVLSYGVVFALGTGIASLIPAGVLVARLLPASLGTANAVVLSGMGLGQLVMMAVAAAHLADVGWRQLFLAMGAVHLVVLPLVALAIARSAATPPMGHATGAPGLAVADGMSLADAVRTRRFWVLLAVYALCGLEDFFVTTHIAAFAQDRGAGVLFAGNLVALMGLMMLLGVLAAGWASDRWGPVAPTLAAFLLRIALFAAVLLYPGTTVVAVFALLFGATFLVTAPLTVVFARDAFGRANLGLFTGLITMVHHIAGGIGGWAGAAWFDRVGNYDLVLWAMLATSALGAMLALLLRPAGGAPP